MSFPSDHTQQDITQHPVRKACDLCHKRKVRCNGRDMLHNRCSNCITASVKCTYTAPVVGKRRGSKAYIRDLETKLANAEKLMNLLSPETDVKLLLDQFDETVLEPPKLDKAPTLPAPGTHPFAKLGLHSTYDEEADGLDLDDEDYTTFSHHEDKQALATHSNQKFFGKSSEITFFRSAMGLKNEWDKLPAPNNRHVSSRMFKTRRPEFWRLAHYTSPPPPPKYKFPEPDLLSSLIDLYFTTMNNLFPLLHRNTFHKSVEDMLQERDHDFAGVVLLVCANGARFSDDPRVMHQSSFQQAGFSWFSQVHHVKRPLMAMPSIYEVQIYCLSAIFLEGVASTVSSWNFIGAGLRFILSIGAHRRQAYEIGSTDSELWNRAFWILLTLDRISSSSLGRMCALREEDFDIRFPTECDDEYWPGVNPDPERAFKQPDGKPSYVSYFVQLAKLNKIHAFGLRSIYAVKRPHNHNFHKNWDPYFVKELDSALMKWLESLPEHLRWDPKREDSLFAKQSALLFMNYYSIRIWIHRTFITSRGHSQDAGSLSNAQNQPWQSLSICLNAARSMCHLVDVAGDKLGFTTFMWVRPMITCVVVMLLNIWSRQPCVNPAMEMLQVKKCMDLVKSVEDRWAMAGRIWDVIHSLIFGKDSASVGVVSNKLQESDEAVQLAFSIELPRRQTVKIMDIGSSCPRHTKQNASKMKSPAEPWHPFKPPMWPPDKEAEDEPKLKLDEASVLPKTGDGVEGSLQVSGYELKCSDAVLTRGTLFGDPPLSMLGVGDDYTQNGRNSYSNTTTVGDINSVIPNSGFLNPIVNIPNLSFNEAQKAEPLHPSFSMFNGNHNDLQTPILKMSGMGFEVDMVDIDSGLLFTNEELAMLTNESRSDVWEDWNVYAQSVRDMVSNLQEQDIHSGGVAYMWQ